ncbi:MAG TPA: glycosyltransferase family 2 protein, partial [Chloroflexi bacterium]|nr:glycosyltransferase family 2 protein [Chloroflexota bacterium]
MSEISRTPCLSVIIVSWNVRELLLQAIDSLKATWQGPRQDLEIIVVDNASTDGTPEMLRSSAQDVRLLINRENRGFAAANNQGLAIARGQYILLLNSDTLVRPQALRRLVAYLETHPDTGLVGPRLLNEDGSIQPSRRRFPTLPILFLESTWLEGLLPRKALALYYVEDRPDDMPQDVDWVTGAAMLVRRETIDEVGPLDEGFFMYSEELDWCRRIRGAGWRIAYEPAAEVVHYGGKSSDQVVAQRHIYFQS